MGVKTVQRTSSAAGNKRKELPAHQTDNIGLKEVAAKLGNFVVSML
jgi:hypothetical protein